MGFFSPFSPSQSTSMTTRRLVTPTSVSYTHLDVYKRQVPSSRRTFMTYIGTGLPMEPGRGVDPVRLSLIHI